MYFTCNEKVPGSNPGTGIPFTSPFNGLTKVASLHIASQSALKQPRNLEARKAHTDYGENCCTHIKCNEPVRALARTRASWADTQLLTISYK